jgi:hypothetical protein
MELTTDLKRDISALFDVFEEASGTQRVVTPLEYPGSGDRVVVRARPRNGHWVIDENGEAAMYARMSGGELNSDSIKRWAENLAQTNRIELDKEEQLVTTVSDARLIAPTLFHVAAAAQQLFALATSAKERETSQFKEQVSNIVREVCQELNVPFRSNVVLPIVGDMEADHVLGDESNPLILVIATSTTRLLEAELMHMQFRASNTNGYVLAVAENHTTVGVKHFNRANYFTDKTVAFNGADLSQLLREKLH